MPGIYSWSRPPDLHRHRSRTGRGSCVGRGRRSEPGAGGGNRTRVSTLPRSRLAAGRRRRGAHERGRTSVSSMSRKRSAVDLRGRNWSGSGDLHAAAPAPQAGGSLSTLEPVEGAAGVAPALTGPRPAVQSCYTSPPENPGRPGRYRAFVSRLSSGRSSFELRAGWSGQRVPPPRSPRWQRGVLLARLWPRIFLVARAGIEPAARGLKKGSAWQAQVWSRREESNLLSSEGTCFTGRLRSHSEAPGCLH